MFVKSAEVSVSLHRQQSNKEKDRKNKHAEDKLLEYVNMVRATYRIISCSKPE